MISAIGVRNVVENKVDFTKSRNLIIAAVILVSGLGFADGFTFTVAGTDVTLTSLAIAALLGILFNAVLPGKDYDLKQSRQKNVKMRQKKAGREKMHPETRQWKRDAAESIAIKMNATEVENGNGKKSLSLILAASIISLWQGASESVMCIVRFILIKQTLQRLKK